MGEARRRAREIAELKQLGVRRVDTPWPTRPVLTVMRGGFNGMDQDTWMILDTEFQTELDRLRARPVDKKTLEETILGLARMALWAERSGVKEAVAQNWFALQQRELHERVKIYQADLRAAPVETRLLARNRPQKGKTKA